MFIVFCAIYKNLKFSKYFWLICYHKCFSIILCFNIIITNFYLYNWFSFWILFNNRNYKSLYWSYIYLVNELTVSLVRVNTIYLDVEDYLHFWSLVFDTQTMATYKGYVMPCFILLGDLKRKVIWKMYI